MARQWYLWSEEEKGWFSTTWGKPKPFKGPKAALRAARKRGRGMFMVVEETGPPGSRVCEGGREWYVTDDDGSLVPAGWDGEDYIPTEGPVPNWIQAVKVERALKQQQEFDKAMAGWDQTFGQILAREAQKRGLTTLSTKHGPIRAVVPIASIGPAYYGMGDDDKVHTPIPGDS